MNWHPITDLPENWQSIASESLARLAAIWVEQQELLKQSKAVKQFNTALKRAWAIETGILEGLYSLDRGITELLIERGIEATLIPHDATNQSPTEIVAILRDQEEALDWVFDFVGSQRPLSASWLKELHALLTQHQSHIEAIDQFEKIQRVALLRGEYKKLPNNPRRRDGSIHEYCPPEHVASEMDRLIEMHAQHLKKGVPPEIESAWLHHRFTQIHPFQDGNGRVARALASLVLLRARWFPLVVDRSQRSEYIEALEFADKGDLEPLVDLVSEIQKRAFLKALSISESIQQERESVQHVLGAALDRLRNRHAVTEEERGSVFVVGERLEAFLFSELQNLRAPLEQQLRQIDQHYRVFVTKPLKGKNDLIFVAPTIELAQQLGYFADTRTYNSWVELRIREERYTDIIFAFHSVGRNFTGLLGVTAFIEFKDIKSERGQPVRVDGPHALLGDVFQFAYTERPEAVEERFRKWLNRALVVGLDQWRKQL